jgi:RNA polymerase sigma-70 factor (ECF subfamily)
MTNPTRKNHPTGKGIPESNFSQPFITLADKINRGSSLSERPFVDEQQAIAHLKQGQLDGLEILVHRYQLQAMRTACLIVGDQSLAEDIVQNAFIRASERIDQFDDQRPFGPWFLRSVVNDSIKVYSRQKKGQSLESVDCEESITLIDQAPLPEALVEAKETSQELQQAMNKLPPDQRAAIVLRYFLDMDESQMVQKLNRPAGTIKWRLSAARRHLARLLYAFKPSTSTKENDKGISPPLAGQNPGEKP